MITHEEKNFILNTYLKNLNCEKYTLNSMLNNNLKEDEIEDINSKITSVDEKIQAIEYEKIHINQGE
jgi:hypothetical protein